MTVTPGKISMSLVETRLKFTKGIQRYNFQFKLANISKFTNYQIGSKESLSLTFESPSPTESRNLDIRFKEETNQTLLTFFVLDVLFRICKMIQLRSLRG